ncbi:hypothetical protein ACKWNM_24205, partial [Escherichia coli]
QNDVTLKMPAFEWVHVQLHQQKGMISLSPPTICNSADSTAMVIQPGSSTPDWVVPQDSEVFAESFATALAALH